MLTSRFQAVMFMPGWQMELIVSTRKNSNRFPYSTRQVVLQVIMQARFLTFLKLQLKLILILKVSSTHNQVLTRITNMTNNSK